MKPRLLLSFICLTLLLLNVQAQHVETLPAGRYGALLKTGAGKWEAGDILLLEGNRYRVSLQEEEGEFRTSITAQRIFFTSGPLKGAYARLVQHNKKPAIELPIAANAHNALVTADIIAVWKQ